MTGAEARCPKSNVRGVWGQRWGMQFCACSSGSKDPALPMLGLVARGTEIPNPVSELLCLPPNARGMVSPYQDFCKQE